MHRRSCRISPELQQPRRNSISPNPNKLFVHVFFCDLQETRSELLAVESTKKEIGGRIWTGEDHVAELPETTEVAGIVLELQKFINGGSSPANPANSAQRCS